MENKKTAVDFLLLVVGHREAEAFDRHLATGFVHHNPFTAAGAANLQAGMESSGASMPGMALEICHVLAEGDLVAVHSRLCLSPEPSGPSMALVHLFRFEGERIAELWDIAQAVPDAMVNTRGMF
jgi:predicted SnoaL-like aldol condensation-catalyzing enzyme